MAINTVLVANPKGGSGKSTLATNLAGYFSRAGRAVMLGDADRQQSSREWLALRSAALPPITSWEISDPSRPARPPKGTRQVILDTPAGLSGKMQERVLKAVQKVLVPVQPSMFDMRATRSFFDALQAEKAVRKEKVAIAVVGMRVDARTRAAGDLQRFLADWEFPVLTHLRDTQLYVQAAAGGLSLFDLPPSRVARDIEQWRPIIDWVMQAD